MYKLILALIIPFSFFVTEHCSDTLCTYYIYTSNPGHVYTDEYDFGIINDSVYRIEIPKQTLFHYYRTYERGNIDIQERGVAEGIETPFEDVKITCDTQRCDITTKVTKRRVELSFTAMTDEGREGLLPLRLYGPRIYNLRANYTNKIQYIEVYYRYSVDKNDYADVWGMFIVRPSYRVLIPMVQGAD